MAIILSNLHLQTVAEYLGEGNTAGDRVRFSFFVNNITPDAASEYADFDREMTQGLEDFYSGRPYSDGGWQCQDYLAIGTNIAGGSEGVTVYGFIIYSARDNVSAFKLVHAHRFASPVNIPADATKNVSVEIRSKARQV